MTAVGELFDMAACWQIMHGAEEKCPDLDMWDFIREMA